MRYRLFGESFTSDRELPFPPAADGAEPSFRLEEHDSLSEVTDLEALGHLVGSRCSIQYGGWLSSMRLAEQYIWYQRRLLGDFDLPFVHVFERLIAPLYVTLTHDAYLCVHGSVVVEDGRAWLVTGDTGSGKSTTAYELMHRHELAIAADEMAVVDVEQGILHGGSPAIRMARREGGVEEACAEGEVHPELEKRWFRLQRRHLAEGSYPLCGVIYLEPREDEDPEFVDVGSYAGSEKLTRLLDQSFDFESAPGAWKRRRFKNAAQLAKSVPVYRFEFGRSESGEATHVPALWEFLRHKDVSSHDEEHR